MTSRDILTSIVKDKRCPERTGLHESFRQDTQREWETQGSPPGFGRGKAPAGEMSVGKPIDHQKREALRRNPVALSPKEEDGEPIV